jgi:toxin ParE1/3/4
LQFPVFPTSGGRLVDGTRELVEAPYIIVYTVDEQGDEIAVLAIVHGATDREG